MSDGTAGLIPTDDIKATIHFLVTVEAMTFKKVAEQFQISEKQCRKFFAEAREQSLKIHKTQAEYVRFINEGIYQRVAAEANEGWKKSSRVKITKTFKEVTSAVKDTDGKEIGKEVKTTEEQKIEEQNGDPRFLNLQIECANRLEDLVGAKAPKKVEVDQKSTIEVYLEIDALPLEERERMARIYDLEEAGLIIDQTDAKKLSTAS